MIIKFQLDYATLSTATLIFSIRWIFSSSGKYIVCVHVNVETLIYRLHPCSRIFRRFRARRTVHPVHKNKLYIKTKTPFKRGLSQNGAGNRGRTGDLMLGKHTLYQLSYSRENQCHLNTIQYYINCYPQFGMPIVATS